MVIDSQLREGECERRIQWKRTVQKVALCEDVLRQEARKRRNTMLRAISGCLSETKDETPLSVAALKKILC